MSYDTWEEVVSAAALGDEEATSMIASRLAAVDRGAAQSSVSAVEAEKRQFLENFKAKAALEEELGISVSKDPEAYALAVQFDENLYKAHPNMEFRERARIAYQAALERLGPQEERDNAAWISQMRAARTGSKVEEEDLFARTRPVDPAEADYSATIAQMAKERMGRKIDRYDPDELEPQRPRMTRASPFPPR
jgi:hypothetical protein